MTKKEDIYICLPGWQTRKHGFNISNQDSFDQCQMLINANKNHGIDPIFLIVRHWSELIGIVINAGILIGIDRHWALKKVAKIKTYYVLLQQNMRLFKKEI